MNSRSYIYGPYKARYRRGFSALTQEALYAFGGLAVAIYLVYALMVA